MNKIVKPISYAVLMMGISLAVGNAAWANMEEASAEPEKAKVSEDNLHNAWENTKEAGSDLWKATKHGASDTGEAISEISGEAWDATKEGAVKAKDAVSEKFD